MYCYTNGSMPFVCHFRSSRMSGPMAPTRADTPSGQGARRPRTNVSTLRRLPPAPVLVDPEERQVADRKDSDGCPAWMKAPAVSGSLIYLLS